jgi:HAD superfamily hydrolase (TIGR01458 family)
VSAGLREQLAGVRGLVLDLDGVLVMRDALLPGAVEALAALDTARIPYVIGTNASLASRATLARELARAGLAVPAGRIVSAASTAAALARRRYGTDALYVMGSPDALTEFAGLRLLSHVEAADPGARAAAVIVGDAGEEFTPRNIQSAFALLRGGAAFVAMHKNRWWITPAGVLLDSGGYVAALEYATERRALVTGKPSRAFFGEAVRILAQLGGRGMSGGRGAPSRLSPAEVAMVGDDLWNDIRGAQKAGLRGVFVRSGKHGDAELARVASERGGRAPDAIAPSIAEVVAALLG